MKIKTKKFELFRAYFDEIVFISGELGRLEDMESVSDEGQEEFND